MRIIYTLLFLGVMTVHAQKQANNWYFGDKAGISFNSGTVTALTNGQTPTVDCTLTCHSEGTAVMSDSSGALLFYTNGQTVWNKAHQVMPNGSALMGHPSATQCLILPKPGSKRYYYIFTTPGFQYNFGDGFRYTLVDMCAQNGMGDVVATDKNVKLLDTIAEKVTAVLHSNGTDYWVLVHKFWSTKFHAFQLTSTGITNTVVTAIGSFHPPGGSPTKLPAIGQMKASPNGQKLAIVCGNTGSAIAEYFDFNAATGVLTNSINVHNSFVCHYYGVSFSPDNTKLYISTLSCGSSTISNGIFQYDLLRGGGQKDSVRASKFKMGSGRDGYFGLQLASNGKIYNARAPLISQTYLGAIMSPNNAGAACNYVDSAVSLAGKAGSYGLPNFLDSFKYLQVQTGNDACPTPTVDVGITVRSLGSILVGPNPCQTFIRIQKNDDNAFDKLELIDPLGRCVFTSDVTETKEPEINITEVSQGMYYYRLLSSGRVIQAGKLLKE
jgi:hypothetical protein